VAAAEEASAGFLHMGEMVREVPRNLSQQGKEETTQQSSSPGKRRLDGGGLKCGGGRGFPVSRTWTTSNGE
jgi:hypothetical protein